MILDLDLRTDHITVIRVQVQQDVLAADAALHWPPPVHTIL